MKKYLTIFRLSIAELTSRRFEFFVWRLRWVIILLSLYFVWNTVYGQSRVIAGYTRDEIMTYVFLGAGFLEAVVFAGVSVLHVADIIKRGELSAHLLRPFSFIRFMAIKDLADKFLVGALGFVEMILFVKIFKINILLPKEVWTLFFLGLAVFLSLAVNFLIGLLVNFLIFWTRQAEGPRFLYFVLRQVASGAFFPLSILPATIFGIVSFLPFSFMLFFPMQIYLEKLTAGQMISGFILGFSWVLFLTLLAHFTWQRGLKRYQAEGA